MNHSFVCFSKTLLALAIGLSLQLHTLAQCSGDIIIDSLNDLEQFPSQHPCSLIDGSLTIYDGSFGIIDDLSYISGLDSITGDLIIYNTFLEDCCLILEIGVGGDVILENNFFGCETLNEINIFCQANTCLTNKVFYSQASIDNFVLSDDCTIFDNVTITGSDITDLSAISLLEGVMSDLTITNCPLLIDLNGLENIQIADRLSIYNNNALQSIEALSSLIEVGYWVEIFDNPNLNTCCSVLNFYGSAVPNIILENNGNNCNSISEIGTACNDDGVCNFDILLDSQDEIDNFESNYFCTEINGNLKIDGEFSSSINDLSPLSNINSVSGDLTIRTNQNLDDCCLALDIEVGGDIVIEFNGDGCDSLEQVDNYCGCEETVNLNSQADVNSFPTDYGCSSVLNLNIQGLDIVDLSPLNSINTVFGSVNIQLNLLLTNLDGLENIGSIGGHLFISHNASLLNLDGLNGLQSIEDGIKIDTNPVLQNIQGLTNITSLGYFWNVIGPDDPPYMEIQSLWISNNNALTNLSGLNNLGSLGAALIITDNAALENVDALSNLNSISSVTVTEFDMFAIYKGGNITIRNNPVLISLEGLENLTGIGYSINCCDIGGYSISAGNRLEVINNESLFSCCFLDNVVGQMETPYLIENNALGCNSVSSASYYCSFETCEIDLVFNTQSEIDNFVNGIDIDGDGTLESCQIINGSITIQDTAGSSSDQITDLSPLFGNLQTILGNVNIVNNPALEDCCMVIDASIVGSVNISNNGNGCIDLSDANQSCDNCAVIDLLFSSQAEIDAFPGNYNCTTLRNLHIQGPDITDLSPLIGLTGLTGFLQVQGNPLLTNLEGLNNLTSIEGYMSIFNNPMLLDINGLSSLTSVSNNVGVTFNNSLLDLNGLNNLGSIDGFFRVKGNNSLQNLNGLGSLNQIEDYFEINSNNSLQNVDGLAFGIDIGTALIIKDNPVLNNIQGFSGLSNLGALFEYEPDGTDGPLGQTTPPNPIDLESLSISGNAALVDLQGLNNLTQIYGLTIENNASLQNLNGLNALTEIRMKPIQFEETPFENYFFGGSIYIKNNNILNSLDALNNLNQVGKESIFYAGFGDEIEILNNPQLTTCCIIPLITYDFYGSTLLTSNFIIENNAPGCNTMDEIYQSCGTCSFDFVVYNQNHVYNFDNSYPYCHFLDGSITVDGDESNSSYVVSNLYPLFSNFEYVTGDVTIVNNPNISTCCFVLDTDIQGALILENNGGTCNSLIQTIQDCGGCGDNIVLSSQAEVDDFPINYDCIEINDLIIDGSDITDLSPLSSITTVNGYLTINNNVNLTNLNGLHNIGSVAEYLSISNNSALSNLNGFGNLLSIGGNVEINNNALLQNLDGINNLESIGGNLIFNQNPSLNSFTGLESLISIEDDLEITENNSLVSFQGLSNLSSINQSFIVSNNEQLTNFDGLLSLSSVGYLLSSSYQSYHNLVLIDQNPSLSSLSGLENLHTIYGRIQISNNNALTDVDGFSGLENLYSALILENNEALVSLSGFTNLSEIYNFFIYENMNNYPNFPIESHGLTIRGNSSLNNLEGLNNIGYIQGSLTIENNALLDNINALSSLNHIDADEFNYTQWLGEPQFPYDFVNYYGGNILINNNPVLSNLNALQNPSLIVGLNENPANDSSNEGEELSLINNPLLEICCFVPDLFLQMDGLKSIENNAIGCNSIAEITDLCSALGESILLRVFLEGAFNPAAGNMFSQLNEFIPLNQPYNNPPWNYNGTESIPSVPANVVDWVLVEARTGTPNLTNANTILVEMQAAILLNDGSIVSPTGSNNGLTFESLIPGESYHFVIRHRNHLDIISADPMFAGGPIFYDFTINDSRAFGNNQLKTINGHSVMYAGDYNGDGSIQTTDYDKWRLAPAVLNTYAPTDGNMDGIIQVTDKDSWYINRARLGSVEIRF